MATVSPLRFMFMPITPQCVSIWISETRIWMSKPSPSLPPNRRYYSCYTNTASLLHTTTIWYATCKPARPSMFWYWLSKGGERTTNKAQRDETTTCSTYVGGWILAEPAIDAYVSLHMLFHHVHSCVRIFWSLFLLMLWYHSLLPWRRNTTCTPS